MDFDALEETEQERCEEDLGLELERRAQEEERRQHEEEARRQWELDAEVLASLRLEPRAHELGSTLGVLFTVEQRDPAAPRRRSSAFFCDVANQALKRLRGLLAAVSGLRAVEERVDLLGWFLNFAVQWHFRPAASRHFERIVVLLQSDGGLCGFLSELLTRGEHRHRGIRARLESVLSSLLEALWRLAGCVSAACDDDRAVFAQALDRMAAAFGGLSHAAPAEGMAGAAAGGKVAAGEVSLAALDIGLAADVARWRERFGKIIKTSALGATRILHELRDRFVRDGFQERYQDLRSRAKVGDAAHMQLINMTWSEQSEVLPKHGYPATPAGLMEMRTEVSLIGTDCLFEAPTAEQLRQWDFLDFDPAVWKLRRDIHLVLDMGQPLPKMLVTSEMLEKRRQEEENERRLRLRPVSRHFHATEISPTLAYYAQGDHRGWGRGYDHLVRVLDDLREELPRDVVLEARRGCVRIINMAQAEARREFMQVKCVAALQERLPWLDVDFVPGVRSGDVAWRAAPVDRAPPACPCGGHASAAGAGGPACCACDHRLELGTPFFSCPRCGGLACQDCSGSGCRCGGQFAPHGSGACWPCSLCGARLESARYYTCSECDRFLCPCCAGRGRAAAEWRGIEVAIDTQLWGPPTADEQAAMRMAWERDAKRGPEAFENHFRHYNEGCDFTKRMSHGFVGSHLAHLDCWRCAAEAQEPGGSWHGDLGGLGGQGPEWLLVVEDDAVPLPEFELDWSDVLALLLRELAALRRSRTPWDLIWVGRSAAMGPEPVAWPEELDGEQPSLLLRPGYCILIHCYCLSRRGARRLLASPLSRTALRPLDEVFGALNIGGQHLRGRFTEKLRELGRGTELLSDFSCLAFPFRGLVAQLEDTDEYGDSELATSHQARTTPPSAA